MDPFCVEDRFSVFEDFSCSQILIVSFIYKEIKRYNTGVKGRDISYLIQLEQSVFYLKKDLTIA